MTNISFRSNIHAACNPFLGVLGGWGGEGGGIESEYLMIGMPPVLIRMLLLIWHTVHYGSSAQCR